MKIALVFPGQGSQNKTMLEEFRDDDVFNNSIDRASSILKYDIKKIVNDEEKLNNTIYTQPIMLAVSCAIWEIFKGKCTTNIQISAGHSLGEYSALVANNTIKYEDGLLLVKKRAEMMSKAMEDIDGSMAAVIGLDGNIVNDICRARSKVNAIVEAVNFNCPGQTVIAGHTKAIDNINSILKDEGAKIIKKLPVSVAAHTSLLDSVAIHLKNELQKIKFNENNFDLVHNFDLSISQTGDDLINVLSKQVCSPVRWLETLEIFKSQKITDVIEIGPGKVLSGLIKRFDKTINIHSTNTIEDIKLVTQAL